MKKIKLVLFAFFFLLLLGCDKKMVEKKSNSLEKDEKNINRTTESVLPENTKTTENLSMNTETPKKTVKEKKQTIDFLRTENIQALGLYKIETFNDLFEKLMNKYDKVESINTILIEDYSIESFRGMELFTSLSSMSLKNCVISDLDNIIIVKDFKDSVFAPSLYLDNCSIEKFSDLSNIPLKELFISMFNFDNESDVLLPVTLRTLHLPACKNVSKCFNQVFPDLIALNLGRIELSEDELRMIIEKCPNLQYLYLDDRCFDNYELIFDLSDMKTIHYIGRESSAYS